MPAWLVSHDTAILAPPACFLAEKEMSGNRAEYTSVASATMLLIAKYTRLAAFRLQTKMSPGWTRFIQSEKKWTALRHFT
jgi:hypothetical protein